MADYADKKQNYGIKWWSLSNAIMINEYKEDDTTQPVHIKIFQSNTYKKDVIFWFWTES